MSLVKHPRLVTLLLLTPLGVLAACTADLNPLDPPEDDEGSGGSDAQGSGGKSSGGAAPTGGSGGKSSGGAEQSSGGSGGNLGGMGGMGGMLTGGTTGSGGGDSCDDADECLAQTESASFCIGDMPGACEDTDADGCLEYFPESSCTTSCNATTGTCTTGDTCADSIIVEDGDVFFGENFYEDFTDTQSLNGTDCMMPFSNDPSPEAFFAVDLKAGQTLTIRESEGIDAIVGLQHDCAGGNACLDSWDAYEHVGKPYTATVDEHISAWITTYRATSVSSISYDISFYIGDCGDGEVSGLEDCDDQNDVAQDGCSECVRDPLDLGSFGLGESIPTLVDDLPLRGGSARSYLITFTEPVWLTGLVTAPGGSSPSIEVRNRDNLYRGLSDEHGVFDAVFLEPGQAELILQPSKGHLDEGITLTLSTPTATDLGMLGVGDSNGFSGGPIPSKGNVYYRFTTTADANVTTTTSLDVGDPDLWGYDADGTRVIMQDMFGTSETFGPGELAAGEYFIRLFNYGPASSTHDVIVSVDAQ